MQPLHKGCGGRGGQWSALALRPLDADDAPGARGLSQGVVPAPASEPLWLYRAESVQSAGSYAIVPSGMAPGLASAGAALFNAADLKQRVLWTEQEDQLLRDLIARYGTTKWSLIASKLPYKTNKHCRRRWQACLNATGNKGAWTVEEDVKLVEGHRVFGNRWTEIAKLVPGRTDNAAKNRFGAITKGNPLYNPAGVGSPHSLSGSESNVTAEASASLGTASDILSGGVSSRKRGLEADAFCNTLKSGGSAKKFLCLDLNVKSGSWPSESEDSAVLQECEEGVDSVHMASGVPKAWIDLNAPYGLTDASREM